MKKLLSMILMMVMVLSLGMNAFASGTGSITITNATNGKEYKVYRVFDATVKKDSLGNIEGVAYSIKPDNQFYTVLFGADGTTPNAFFDYDKGTGIVTKAAGVLDSALTEYLTGIVQSGTYTPSAAPIIAGTSPVTFAGLPYGYYVITSTLGTVVTINSNTPDVSVIDKNQEPGDDFKKEVWDEDAIGGPAYAESNSAGLGDQLLYKVSFEATNYDGDQKIKYYQIHDSKGSGIWVEFNNIHVKVNGVELHRGYYLCQGDPSLNTDSWEYLGDWTGVEKNRNNAEWYLVHLGYDEFRITIPWLAGHTLVDVTDALGNVVSHNLNFPANAASKFASPVDVEVTYTASVEGDATIGGGASTNLRNTATGSWTSEHDTEFTPPDTVETKVYGLGILKDDASTHINLAGAKFRIYKDAACTQPVYVVPSNIDGVYRVDSKGTYGESISGSNTVTARKLVSEARLSAYLGGDLTKQDNYVVTQANGKLVILGLEKGTYYLSEVEAPAGYNALSDPVAIEVGVNTKDFLVFANPSNGAVADIQTTDGVHVENIFKLSSDIVHNSKGVQLPTTGGAGRTAILTIGTLMAIGFAVLLITHKKMSIYSD